MLNKLIYQGRLTKEPELRHTSKTNTAILLFTLACLSDRKNKDGEQQTNFQQFKAIGATAEFIAKYFKKGYMMLVDASLETETYKDKDGNNRYSTYGWARHVHFCGSKPDNQKTTTNQTVAMSEENSDEINWEEFSESALPF